ncbi:MAG: hypothetical protein M1497_14330 [Nitrospirae bacterium]|nr:hypothetical protein [Nitrospirota bacterium]
MGRPKTFLKMKGKTLAERSRALRLRTKKR